LVGQPPPVIRDLDIEDSNGASRAELIFHIREPLGQTLPQPDAMISSSRASLGPLYTGPHRER